LLVCHVFFAKIQFYNVSEVIISPVTTARYIRPTKLIENGVCYLMA